MKVVHLASEVAPWSQSGGLGQVVGALPSALLRRGVDTAIISPLYREVRERAAAAGAVLSPSGLELTVELGGEAIPVGFVSLRATDAAPIHFVDCPRFFDRPSLYGEGTDYPDNDRRFALLCRAALAGAERLMAGPIDVVHSHDWQAGLAPAYLTRLGRRPRTVFTIHNLAFQGLFPKSHLGDLGLDWSLFHLDGLEFWDQLSFLKGGIAFADAVTTVSPRYADEITRPESGAGLDGFFRHRGGVLGILNGIDTAQWDPSSDPHIAAPFSTVRPSGKSTCRRALLDEVGLADGDALVLAVVSRLTEQKGLDLIAELVPALRPLGARLVVLGSGDEALEQRFAALAHSQPDHLAVRFGFDQPLAHRIFAGADALLMPSRFEPCGLAQMSAMRYGTLPIASPVGGLADTVHDPGDAALAAGQGTGFLLRRPDVASLVEAVTRAAALRRDRSAWSRAVASAMAHDWSWSQPASQYHALYQRLLA
jgi:starch synthase